MFWGRFTPAVNGGILSPNSDSQSRRKPSNTDENCVIGDGVLPDSVRDDTNNGGCSDGRKEPSCKDRGKEDWIGGDSLSREHEEG